MTKSILVLTIMIILVFIVGWLLVDKSNNVPNLGINSGPSITPIPTPTPTPAALQVGKTTSLPSGLKIQDLRVGTGLEAKTGDTVSVNYLGTFVDGTKFDSSYDRGKPFEFTLGAGQVIKGWDLGVAGMKIGGKRKLVISSDLAYGSRKVGPIPPDSTLVFEVELLSVGSNK